MVKAPAAPERIDLSQNPSSATLIFDVALGLLTAVPTASGVFAAGPTNRTDCRCLGCSRVRRVYRWNL